MKPNTKYESVPDDEDAELKDAFDDVQADLSEAASGGNSGIMGALGAWGPRGFRASREVGSNFESETLFDAQAQEQELQELRGRQQDSTETSHDTGSQVNNEPTSPSDTSSQTPTPTQPARVTELYTDPYFMHDDQATEDQDSSPGAGASAQSAREPVTQAKGKKQSRPRNYDGVFNNLKSMSEKGRSRRSNRSGRGASGIGALDDDDDEDESINLEQPPSYETAAADHSPPYWEATTMFSPEITSTDVYIDGLPVGSMFAFFWSLLISVSFQVVGFLLTYVIHSSHAMKNGSKAGLGLTLVQYGVYLRQSADYSEFKASATEIEPINIGQTETETQLFDDEGNEFLFIYQATNSQANFPISPASNGDQIKNREIKRNLDEDSFPGAFSASHEMSIASSSSPTSASINTSNEYLSIILMAVGWFLFLRSIFDFARARRTQQCMLETAEQHAPESQV